MNGKIFCIFYSNFMIIKTLVQFLMYNEMQWCSEIDNFTLQYQLKNMESFQSSIQCPSTSILFTKFLGTYNSGFQVIKLTFDIMHIVFDIWYIPLHWATTSVAPKICFINHHTLSCWGPTHIRLLPRSSFLKKQLLIMRGRLVSSQNIYRTDSNKSFCFYLKIPSCST